MLDFGRKTQTLLKKYGAILLHLTQFNIKREFSATYGSFAWWFLEPLIMMCVYYLLFGIILNARTDNFLLFLLTGLIIWRWFQVTMMQAAGSVRQGRSLCLQVYLPKILFPLQSCLINTCKYLVALSLLLLIMVFTQKMQLMSLIYYPLIFFVQLAFIVGCALTISAVVPFFPDLKNLLGFVLRALFYVSGILFDISRLPDKLQHYLYLNPISILIEAQRGLFLEGIAPNIQSLFFVLCAAIMLIVLGIYMHLKFDRIYTKLAF